MLPAPFAWAVGEVVPLQYSFTSNLISTFCVICSEGYYLSWLGNMNEPWGVETYASRKIPDDFNQSDARQIHQVEHEWSKAQAMLNDATAARNMFAFTQK